MNPATPQKRPAQRPLIPQPRHACVRQNHEVIVRPIIHKSNPDLDTHWLNRPRRNSKRPTLHSPDPLLLSVERHIAHLSRSHRLTQRLQALLVVEGRAADGLAVFGDGQDL